jgi:2-amino-4-hydroxy-6-hydroxymethyldihydropteridine diphosphokinase
LVQAGKSEQNDAKVLVALGSNVTSRHGDPVATVEAAIRVLARDGRRLVARSRLYRTPFVPAGGGADVINAAVLLDATLAPEALLAELHRIEAAFERSREVRWGSRTLDLDLLAVGQRIRPDRSTFLRWQEMTPSEQSSVAPDRLILPHPRLQDRAFALVPAADVAPEWRHPVLGRSIAEMLAALPPEDVAAVRPVKR